MESLPRIVEAVIAAKGGPTLYYWPLILEWDVRQAGVHILLVMYCISLNWDVVCHVLGFPSLCYDVFPDRLFLHLLGSDVAPSWFWLPWLWRTCFAVRELAISPYVIHQKVFERELKVLSSEMYHHIPLRTRAQGRESNRHAWMRSLWSGPSARLTKSF